MEINRHLAQAIDALKLAAECGGDLDQPVYQKAHKDLVWLRDEIVAHDAKLNADEESPTGDDYEALIALLGLQLETSRRDNGEYRVATAEETRQGNRT